MTVAQSNWFLFESKEIVTYEAGTPSVKRNFFNFHECNFTPYVPITSDELVQKFYKGIEGNIQEARYPLAGSFTILSPKDLANFSEVSKGCYLVTKCTSIWLFQFKELFTNVQPCKELYSYNVEVQFKIFYKRLHDERRLFVNQYNKNEAELRVLRGPTGFDGSLDRAWKEYIQAASENDGFPPGWAKETRKHQEYLLRNLRRIELGGDSYDGTPETLGSVCLQRQLLNAIEHGVSDHFNNQEGFEQVILVSKRAKEELEQASKKS
jgi:hypothetical protein